IRRVIDLARVASEEAETLREEPRSGPVYTLLESWRPGPVRYRHALREYLLGHPEDVISMLTLIMYVGRGNVRINDLARQYKRVRAQFETPKEAVNQMVEKTRLPDYLVKGLRLLAKRGINVDGLLRR